MAYHPQTNSKVQQYNCTLVWRLGLHVSRHLKDLDTYKQRLSYAHNKQTHRATGTSPFIMMLLPELLSAETSQKVTRPPNDIERDFTPRNMPHPIMK